jgi:hypothetical protein
MCQLVSVPIYVLITIDENVLKKVVWQLINPEIRDKLCQLNNMSIYVLISTDDFIIKKVV